VGGKRIIEGERQRRAGNRVGAGIIDRQVVAPARVFGGVVEVEVEAGAGFFLGVLGRQVRDGDDLAAEAPYIDSSSSLRVAVTP
jgi:hypothetical protein